MQPKLKQDPREWRKFMLSASAAVTLAVALAGWRGRLAERTAVILLSAIGLLALAALVKPTWFRLPYRLGMTVGFWIGQVMGRLLLLLFFLLALTPLALLRRLLGRDLLSLRRDPGADSYWRAAAQPGDLDRQF